jgi:hypothetical protein
MIAFSVIFRVFSLLWDNGTAMRLVASLSLASSLLVAAPAFASQPGPSSLTVRNFFGALEQRDFGGALAFTGGDAQCTVARLLEKIRHEAARKHAKVELKVRNLQVVEHPATAGQVPVEVTYQVDVIGKKWIFRRVARRLSGTAHFYVDEKTPRIVTIVGHIDSANP